MNRKKLITLILAALLMLSLAVPAFAALASKNITVYPGVKLYYNDKSFIPKDVNGTPVDAFIYNGTTYLPVRAVSNMLGVNISWDGTTQSVYIGKHDSKNPVCYLDELDYFVKTGIGLLHINENRDDFRKDNLGNFHDHIFRYDYGSTPAGYTYVLNGQYSALSGTLFQRFSYRDTTAVATFTVYGDGIKLYSGTMTGGNYPVDFNIDLTGVLELKIEMSGKNDGATLGEVALWG